MSRVSKSFATFALLVVLNTGNAYARPSQDPGSGAETTIASRINQVIKVVKHLVKVVIGTGDDMSVPVP